METNKKNIDVAQKIKMLEQRQTFLETGIDKTYNEMQERTIALVEALDKTLQLINRLITLVETINALQRINNRRQK